ncbi:MAG: MarR family transcriptional regulator [Rivularia sp. T60_A2020_040]|nr:MarR family transcriptional regulator [Rivularia sp. T60_A2020_040]
MTQSSSKIQGKFYPLQHEEFLSACHHLTPAQLMVLYFLRTLDPYGDGVEVSVSEIARRLSTESKEVHRSTVSRALKALDEKGFIDLELLKVKVKVSSRGLHCCDETTMVPTDNSVASPQQARSSRNKRDHDATSVIMTQHARSSRNKREPEPLPDKDSGTPKTIKTYLDFKDSLSEAERESFLEFSLKKTSQLPKPPQLPMKWIETHFEELKNLWEQQNNTYGSHYEAVTSTNVLNFENWDASTHEGQYHTLMNLGLAKFCENSTSKAWYEWAKVKYPSKFVDVPQ